MATLSAARVTGVAAAKADGKMRRSRETLLVADMTSREADCRSNRFRGCHSLWRAAQCGNLDGVVRELDEGVDVNSRTASGETALHIASAGGYVGVVRRLLTHPLVNTNVMSSEGSTPLHLACHRGHAAVIILLMRHPQTSVNVGWTSCCATPLFLAVKQGCEAAVAVILREPAVDPNCRVKGIRATPLHMAVYNCDAAIVARLVQRADTNVRARTKDGVLPVDIALMTEQKAVLWLLVEAEHGRSARRSEAAARWRYLCLRAAWHYTATTPSESAPAAHRLPGRGGRAAVAVSVSGGSMCSG